MSEEPIPTAEDRAVIASVVDSAPPLSSGARDRLAILLGGA